MLGASWHFGRHEVVGSEPTAETVLALVQSGVDAAAQLNVLQPVQGEQAALDFSQFLERYSQSVLTGIASELAQQEKLPSA